MTGQQDEATAVWDRRYGGGDIVPGTAITDDDVQYLNHPFLHREAAQKRLTRAGELDYFYAFESKYMQPPIKRLLALGSGTALSEERLVRAGWVEHCTVYEASPVACAAAYERMGPRADIPADAWWGPEVETKPAPRSGDVRDRFEFHSTDILKDNIPDASFDAIFVHAAIHHFFEIEEMFKLMHRVLKPGGLLFFNEFVGPDHMLHEDRIYDIMDEIDDCLPPEYRRDVIQQLRVREGVIRPTLEGMLALDPSECVHSSRILPLTYQYFHVEERRDFGGTFLRPFFAGILRNFNFEDTKDQTILRLIVLIESLLLRSNVIPHDNTTVVARRRDKPRAPLTASEAERIAYGDWKGLPDAPPPEPMYMPPVPHSKPALPHKDNILRRWASRVKRGILVRLRPVKR